MYLDTITTKIESVKTSTENNFAQKSLRNYHKTALIGVCSQGPFAPIIIHNLEELYKTFGVGHHLVNCAEQCLITAKEVIICRIPDAKDLSFYKTDLDSEEYDIDILAAPGITSELFIQSMIDFCEKKRSDCMAIIDTPSSLSLKEAEHWIKKISISDFAIAYWPWVQIYDTLLRENILIPPSGSAIAAISRADTLAGPWASIAGQTYGIVPAVLDIEESTVLTSDVINIIGRSKPGNCVIKSSRTLAGNSLSTRRMLFYIEKNITALIKNLADIYEVNDEVFIDKFRESCEYILQYVKNGGGINRYTIRMDDAIYNTPEAIGLKKEFRALVGVQPREAKELVYIGFKFRSS